jgi:hypothetical protein
MAESAIHQIILKFEGNDINVKAYEAGSMSFSTDAAEHFIYFYPHQVKMLKAFIADLEDLTRRAT